MSEQTIKPEKITKPIQLLGAWLAGLLSIDSCFLIAAANMEQGSFESYALTIASITNVPIFLLAVFLLQTKFRPELQEDSYYSTYLSQRTNRRITVSRSEAHLSEISSALFSIKKAIELPNNKQGSTAFEVNSLLFGINDALPDYHEIKAALSAQGADNQTSFGIGAKPEKRVAALSPSLTRTARNRVLKIVKELGFEEFSYFGPGEDDIVEDVLLGAYGDSEQDIS